MGWLKTVWGRGRGREDMEFTISLSCKRVYMFFFPFVKKAAINALVLLPQAPEISANHGFSKYSRLLSPPCTATNLL